MARLIAFDQQTASTLVARTRTTAQLGHGSALKAALANENGATLLMPGRKNDEVLVVSVRRPAREKAIAQAQAVPPPPPQKPQQSTLQKAVEKLTSPLTTPRKSKDDPVAYEATGFLGLDDSPVYEEDIAEQEKQAKKKWWQKLLD